MRVLIPLAAGCEEMEAVIMIDILRRADIDVVAASLGDGLEVVASRDVKLVADALWDDLDLTSFAAIALPGGMGGTRAMQADERVLQALRDFDGQGKLVAAICAAPLVLQSAAVIKGRRVTCHPGVTDELESDYTAERVVEDGHLITSQGPGTAMEFSLALIRRLVNAATADEIAAELVL